MLEKNKNMLLNILVVEPDHLVRKGIISFLIDENDIRVVGEASSASEALEKLKELKVDIILTELWVKDENQSLLARLNNFSGEKPRIVVLTSSQEAQHLFDAMRLGAQGYLLKSLSPETWKEVIRGVYWQDRPLASQVACEILREFADQLGKEKPKITELLSNREIEILKLVAKGLTNKEIGADLNISPHTVKNHLQRILEKVGAENRAQLVAMTIQAGLIN